ncbi:unnamed protein product, partial [Ectocarpus sp. 12 AP-2014]
ICICRTSEEVACVRLPGSGSVVDLILLGLPWSRRVFLFGLSTDHDHFSPIRKRHGQAAGHVGRFLLSFGRRLVSILSRRRTVFPCCLAGGGIKSSHARPFPPLALRTLVTENDAQTVSIRKRDPQQRHSTREDDGEENSQFFFLCCARIYLPVMDLGWLCLARVHVRVGSGWSLCKRDVDAQR